MSVDIATGGIPSRNEETSHTSAQEVGYQDIEESPSQNLVPVFQETGHPHVMRELSAQSSATIIATIALPTVSSPLISPPPTNRHDQTLPTQSLQAHVLPPGYKYTCKSGCGA